MGPITKAIVAITILNPLLMSGAFNEAHDVDDGLCAPGCDGFQVFEFVE